MSIKGDVIFWRERAERAEAALAANERRTAAVLDVAQEQIDKVEAERDTAVAFLLPLVALWNDERTHADVYYWLERNVDAICAFLAELDR